MGQIDDNLEDSMMKAAAGWIVAALIVTLALAGDPTCPSDVDGDNNVGTTDLLQMLGDWGPCPSPPQVIQIDTRADTQVLRLWSDGRIECGEQPPVAPCIHSPVEWCEIPNEPPHPRDVRIAQVQIGPGNVMYRLLSDGTIEVNRPSSGSCYTQNAVWCGWEVVP